MQISDVDGDVIRIQKPTVARSGAVVSIDCVLPWHGNAKQLRELIVRLQEWERVHVNATAAGMNRLLDGENVKDMVK